MRIYPPPVAYPSAGATWKQWWDASLIESKATFNKARNELLGDGLVEQREQRYFVTSGRGLLRSTLGLIDLDRPKAERSTRSTLPKGVDLVDLGEVHKLLQTKPAVLQGNEAQTAAENGARTVVGFFANPPSWLPTQLKVSREDPEKHIKSLCTAVAAVVLDDGLRWGEVREEVERILEEDARS
jgi:hypothetical protein